MYVTRDNQGNITGIFSRPQEFETEKLPDDHPDITSHRNRPPSMAKLLEETEQVGVVARKLEEVVDNIVNGTPISQEAVDWLNQRKTIRG